MYKERVPIAWYTLPKIKALIEGSGFDLPSSPKNPGYAAEFNYLLHDLYPYHIQVVIRTDGFLDVVSTPVNGGQATLTTLPLIWEDELGQLIPALKAYLIRLGQIIFLYHCASL
jgi:hypothetical protein